MSGPRPYASPSCLALGPGTLGWLAGGVWPSGAGSGYREGEGEGVGLYSRTIIAISGGNPSSGPLTPNASSLLSNEGKKS
jgi:hypothetical protein